MFTLEVVAAVTQPHLNVDSDAATSLTYISLDDLCSRVGEASY